MKKKEHLPLFGVGPIYVYTIALFTIIAFLCRNMPVFEAGKLTFVRIPLLILGAILIALGIIIWVMAVIVSKVDDNIKKNHLVTTGIYAWVRNPIYSAFMIANTGIILSQDHRFKRWFEISPIRAEYKHALKADIASQILATSKRG